MSAPKSAAKGEKNPGGQRKRRDLRELRLKFHYLKINDPLLDAAVSYSDHPLRLHSCV